MPSDSAEVDAALLALLRGDAQLTAALPDGVHMDEAPAGTSKFAIVSLQHETDEPMLNGETAFEDATYLVKAVTRETGSTAVHAGAKRIHELLQGAALTPTGYTPMVVRRLERVRYTEVDDNSDFRWQHQGGLYQVMVSPT